MVTKLQTVDKRILGWLGGAAAPPNEIVSPGYAGRAGSLRLCRKHTASPRRKRSPSGELFRRLEALVTKLLGLALCVMLLTSLPLPGAFAEARLPANRGTVTDDADVLGAQTAEDISSYARLAAEQTQIGLHVAIVHFLDGLDAQTYADRLFTSWGLGENDMLVLGAAGEDTFATAMGEAVKGKLGEKNAENLMFTSSEFSGLFRAQQYDAAFGKYFLALNTLLNKQYGTSMKLGDRFKDYQSAGKPAATPKPTVSVAEYGSQLWDEVMDAIQDSTENYQSYHENRRREGNGMSAGGWIVLAIIILIIFGQSDPVRKARRQSGRNYRSYGCGCSPLGWLLSLFGLNVLIDSFRKKR